MSRVSHLQLLMICFSRRRFERLPRRLGVEISFPRSKEALIEKAREQPQLILVDLHNQKIDPVALARELKADEQLRDDSDWLVSFHTLRRSCNETRWRRDSIR